MTGFDAFDLSAPLRRGIEAAGFLEPRPIQVEAIPAILAGRDVLGLAQTGTGKTAAFALPILQRLSAEGREKRPRALVVAPTRELAMQIEKEIATLARFTKIGCASVFGGVPLTRNKRALATHPAIVVACPGRLLDLLSQRAVELSAVEVLVLDEADHMFDMGFLPDVRRILGALPKRRQNLLFSATMPPEIRGLADQVLVKPHVVELAHSKPASTIDHALYAVAQTRKIELLDRLLGEPDFTQAMVFCRTKHRARRLAQQLAGIGHQAVALQGNMSQGQRERAMAGFRSGRFDVLVATDIAARGIDVPRVSHVVNFDFPGTPEAYTHRIGRTGRAELTGRACTFTTREDTQLVRALERHLGAPVPRVVEPGFEGEPVGEPERGRRAASSGSRNARNDSAGRGARGSTRKSAAPERARTPQRERTSEAASARRTQRDVQRAERDARGGARSNSSRGPGDHRSATTGGRGPGSRASGGRPESTTSRPARSRNADRGAPAPSSTRRGATASRTSETTGRRDDRGGAAGFGAGIDSDPPRRTNRRRRAS